MENQGANPMKQIQLEKVVINMGIGSEENMFQNAKMLLEKLTSHKPVATKARKRAPEFKIRKGQIIGAMVTLRRDEARSMLKRALEAVDNTVKESSIAGNSLSFGVSEYIYFSGIKYDPKIGMFGVNVNATFARRGKRVERRKRKTGAVGMKHSQVMRDEIVDYIGKNFNAKISGG
ncbi:MAG: 50S ribosomal protein L5 [Candidatus Micrarchaeota archaeon]|nr:50S ribosomal protein L5 [Candidatus Micrarchaeota archaeon]